MEKYLKLMYKKLAFCVQIFVHLLNQFVQSMRFCSNYCAKDTKDTTIFTKKQANEKLRFKKEGD